MLNYRFGSLTGYFVIYIFL